MRKLSYNEENVKVVRNKVLDDIKEVLDESAKSKKFGKFKQEMLLKLAPTVMPRVQEISGPDGEAIVVSWLNKK